MNIEKQREIVIEFEKIQVIRRRARTEIINCPECRQKTDFISLSKAAELFTTDAARLFEFINKNLCHHQTDDDGEIYICLISVLSKLKDKTRLSANKLLGD